MSYRIVVADKDPRSREAVTRLLVSEDNEFVPVSSSGELNIEIKKQKPDLIILNAVLADTPDWSRVRRIISGIKESRNYGDVPVLLMTGDPGGPSSTEAENSGADSYLSKPLNGDTLKSAVKSLLGLGTGSADADDGDLMIDFTDDDSGDMTEELLAMSNVVLTEDEPSTDIGDTVEIDTGTLVAELDQPQSFPPEDEPYEDTVRLNIDDMGLEDEMDDMGSFEPTIELVADIPGDFGGALTSVGDQSVEIDLDDGSMPDFDSMANELGVTEVVGKDSVTVEMDMDELQLEMPGDDTLGESEQIGRIDPYDTEIGTILGVQEPSKVLTSEDLLLDEDAVSTDSTDAVLETGTEFNLDVIDLEEDTEIAQMDMEELEAVHPDDSDAFGIVQEDETVPLETSEMDQLAKEDLGEIDLDLVEDTMTDSPDDSDSLLELGPMYESSNELSLEESSDEEFVTQEFYGEELPTQEFPAENFLDAKLPDGSGLSEISLDDDEDEEDIDLGDALSLEETETSDEFSDDDVVVLDTGTTQDILLETKDDEPMVEVTEDISFDELGFEEQPESKVESDRAVAAKSSVVEEVPMADMPSSRKAEEKQVAPTAGFDVPRTPISVPSSAPIGAELVTVVSSLVGESLKAAIPGKMEFSDSICTAVTAGITEKDHFSDSFNKTIQASLPTKEELLEGLLKGLSDSIPSRDEIFAHVDQTVAQALPSKEVVDERIDQAIKGILPTPEAILERMDNVLHAVPPAEDILKRFEESVPSADDVLARIDERLKGFTSSEMILQRVEETLKAIPSPHEIQSRFDAAIPAAETLSDSINERIDAVLGAMPSPSDIEERFRNAIAEYPTREDIIGLVDISLRAMPSTEDMNRRLDEAFRAFPKPESVMERLDTMLSAMPTREEIQARLEKALEAIPTRDELTFRVERALSGMPTPDSINHLFQEALAELPDAGPLREKLDALTQAVPTQKEVRESFDKALLEAIPADMLLDRLNVALRALPSHEYVRLRLESAFEALPTRDILNQKVDMALTAIPTREEVLDRLDAALAGLPTTDVITDRVDNALKSIPDESRIMAKVEETLKGIPGPEVIMSQMDEYIAKLVPTKEAVQENFRELMGQKLEGMVSEDDLREALLEQLPQTAAILETIRYALPDRDRFQETLSLSLTDAVRDSLPERVWMESVSRGLFDERTKGVLPNREEVLQIMRTEIQAQVLHAVEKAVRDQIELLTKELDS